MRKITQKVISFCLTFAMLLTMTAVPSMAADTSENSENTDWYAEGASQFTLNDAADLAGLAKLVNEGNDFGGKTVELGNDIDLSGISSWIPVGTVSISAAGIPAGEKAFAGTFDGKEHSITGLNCSVEAGGAALFGYSTGTLKNFTLNGSVSGGACTAGVLAFGSGTLENIINEATVTSAENYVGGIVGDASGDITITGCHNKAVVTNGGVSSEKSTGRIAGIIGRVDSGKKADITECSNTGAITGYQYVGGIIGGSFGSADIQSCYNSGSITGISFGMVHLGGIAGELVGGTIDSCYNIGSVNDRPWDSGHIRGVGGLAGDEQGRPDGSKAITNSYNAGVISLDTSKMQGKYIYMTGNISGGNKKTDPNTMVYENCFYLDGAMQVGNPEYWGDVYKNDNKAYDTSYITKCTEAELKSEAVISALGSKFKAGENGGYPILKWQDGSAETPETPEYAISCSITGGTARADVPSSAAKDSKVEFTIPYIEAGKQIKKVTADDAAGNNVEITEDSAAGKYSFVMPGRAVNVYIVLENTVPQDAASYKIALPQDLDAIWSISVDSRYYDELTGAAKAGASVTVVVNKEQNAANTTFTGISVNAANGAQIAAEGSNIKGKADSVYYGEYTFTMPESDVTVDLDVKYADLTVSQEKDSSVSATKTYSRSDMLSLAGARERAYISGWSTETVPFIAAAEKYVKLSELLKDAGVSFEKGDKLKLKAEDGFVQTYTYESLMETERSYYSDILTNGKNASQKSAVEPIITITANMTSDAGADLSGLVCDTLNTYRLYFGQSEDELKNAVKIVDSLPKNLVSITVEKAASSTGGGGSSGGGSSAGPDTSGLDLRSKAWDGKTVDVSWYFGNESDSGYTISTAAELAGAAALINGLVNSNCEIYTGSEVISATKWNSSSKYVNNDVGTPGDNNQATAEYHYGIESFKDKTLYLSSDLDMSGGNYMPLGGQYLMTKNDTSTKISASFSGMFDGGGHTVNIECDRYCSKNYGDGESIGLIGRLGVHDSDSSSLRPSGAGVCDVAVTGSIKGNRSVGGVVGKIGKTSGTAVIERCANKADITGTDAKGTGGICGSAWNDGAIKDCYNTGKVTNSHNSYGGIAGSAEISIVNCYNVGKVSGNGKSPAIATSNGGDSYENCYWLKGTADMGVYNKPSISGVSEMSDADMKSEDFAAKLGSEFAYKSGGYPVLKWEGGSSGGGAAGGGGAVPGPTAPGTTVQPPETVSGYSDVVSGAWYSEAVKYVTDNKLMNGTGSGKFSPSASTTRGMIMTILARMSGTDTTGSSPWYQKGLDWAVSKNISDGTKPEGTMTREQLATMLYRYSQMMGYDTTQGGMAIREYSDFNKISSYASDAMTWAVNNKIITGVTASELQPQGSATRAQIATILMRWSELNKKAQ